MTIITYDAILDLQTALTCDWDAEAVAASGTITAATVVACDTATINGLVYTGVVGARANNITFSVDTGNCAVATDLAAAVTADCRAGTLNDVTATSCADVVTLTQTVTGVAGNATTLVSSGATLTVSGALFTGGACVGAAPTVDIVWDKKVVGFDSDTTERILLDPQTETVKPFALHGDAYWHDLLIKVDVRTYQTGGITRQNIVVKEVTRIIQNIIRRDSQGFLQVVIGNNTTKNADFRNMFRHLIDLRYQDVNNHTFV